MDETIIAILAQDGVILGAIYALLAVALVLVFSVTRVILVPQGDFVTFAGLTMAALEMGRPPTVAVLLVGLGCAAFLFDCASALRKASRLAVLRSFLWRVVLSSSIALLSLMAHYYVPGRLTNILTCFALIVPMGAHVYRIAFQPLANASVLVLLISAVGAHIALMSLGLLVFGAEGYRTTALLGGEIEIGSLVFTGQSLLVLGVTAVLLLTLAVFFKFTIWGKALRASAVSRSGAQLVGIAPNGTGEAAFAMAAGIGVISALLIGPMVTLYFDSGFYMTLKGFVAAMIGGMAGYIGAVAAALGVGGIESFASFWFSAIKDVLVFAAIIPVLLWRSMSHHTEEE